MDEKDLDIYLRARNSLTLGNTAMGVAHISVGLAFIASFIPGLAEYVKYLLLFAVILGTSTYGVGARTYVSRRELLALIERHINSDAMLIKLLANRS